MVVKLSRVEKKVRYDKKLCSLLDEYGKVLIAAADNVGSNQLQSIRRGLCGDSVILMGKNTLIRRCIRFHTEKTGNKDFLNLLPLLVGNVGLIFTKGDLKEVSEEVAKYKGSASDSIVKFQFPSWAYLSTIFFGIIFIFYANNIAEERVKYSKDILSYLEDLWLNDECQYNGSMLDVFLAASCFFFSKASNDFWKTGQGLDDPWSNRECTLFCFDLVTLLEKLKRMCSFSSYNQHLMALDVFLKQLHLGDLEEVLKILSQDQRENFKKIFRCLHFQADDFTNLKYSRVEIDEVWFEWAECMLDYI
ncbi:hypothetical protein ZIOFF_031567 [Zingiber officinale]|uniref:Uncharacterized protein n=1 Tax=Zingiber officinale TaxID=94328 RepID=A0A8J5GLL2_ZINOF|nr:hypothetical protein ZIOFF_031567 [Zingiber officinale]